ncbi:uncharacterized protein LOC114365201, partial [Ostrinia furnacalis]|uniref:uncharacterized protein LOC114365201 n=1 Tax=Ostrinia furnacalis TaxID=93504 RepID=UPI00103D4ED4
FDSVDCQNVKIKQEPIDPDDEPVITAEELSPQPTIDTTHTTVLSSIDGNLQLDSAPATAPVTGGIRINISKSIPAPAPADRLDDVSADDEPLPPGEEPELEYTLKPALQGRRLSRQPPVMKGNELSGLCSIM